jgi:hypothetical protein
MKFSWSCQKEGGREERRSTRRGSREERGNGKDRRREGRGKGRGGVRKGEESTSGDGGTRLALLVPRMGEQFHEDWKKN